MLSFSFDLDFFRLAFNFKIVYTRVRIGLGFIGSDRIRIGFQSETGNRIGYFWDLIFLPHWTLFTQKSKRIGFFLVLHEDHRSETFPYREHR